MTRGDEAIDLVASVKYIGPANGKVFFSFLFSTALGTVKFQTTIGNSCTQPGHVSLLDPVFLVFQVWLIVSSLSNRQLPAG